MSVPYPRKRLSLVLALAMMVLLACGEPPSEDDAGTVPLSLGESGAPIRTSESEGLDAVVVAYPDIDAAEGGWTEENENELSLRASLENQDPDTGELLGVNATSAPLPGRHPFWEHPDLRGECPYNNVWGWEPPHIPGGRLEHTALDNSPHGAGGSDNPQGWAFGVLGADDPSLFGFVSEEHHFYWGELARECEGFGWRSCIGGKDSDGNRMKIRQEKVNLDIVNYYWRTSPINLDNPGHNHIGDIDFRRSDDNPNIGFLYVPLENGDEPNCQNRIVVYEVERYQNLGDGEYRLNFTLHRSYCLMDADKAAWVAIHPMNPKLAFTHINHNQYPGVHVYLLPDDDQPHYIEYTALFEFEFFAEREPKHMQFITGGGFSPTGLLYVLSHEAESVGHWGDGNGMKVFDSFTGKQVDDFVPAADGSWMEYEGVAVFDFTPYSGSGLEGHVRSMTFFYQHAYEEWWGKVFEVDHASALFEVRIPDRDGDGLRDGIDPCPDLHWELDSDLDCIPDDEELPESVGIWNPVDLDPDQDCRFAQDIGRQIIDCVDSGSTSSGLCARIGKIRNVYVSHLGNDQRAFKELMNTNYAAAGFIPWEAPGCGEIFNPASVDPDNDCRWDHRRIMVDSCLPGDAFCEAFRRVWNRLAGNPRQVPSGWLDIQPDYLPTISNPKYLDDSGVSNPRYLDNSGDGWFDINPGHLSSDYRDETYRTYSGYLPDQWDARWRHTGGTPDPCSKYFLPKGLDQDMDCIHDTQDWVYDVYTLHPTKPNPLAAHLCDATSPWKDRPFTCRPKDNCTLTQHGALCQLMVTQGISTSAVQACYNPLTTDLRRQRNLNYATEKEYWGASPTAVAQTNYADGPTTFIGDACDMWPGIDPSVKGFPRAITPDHGFTVERCGSLEFCLGHLWSYNNTYIELGMTLYGPRLYGSDPGGNYGRPDRTERNTTRRCICPPEDIDPQCGYCDAGRGTYRVVYASSASHVYPCPPGSPSCEPKERVVCPPDFTGAVCEIPEWWEGLDTLKFTQKYTTQDVYYLHYKDLTNLPNNQEPTPDLWWDGPENTKPRLRLSYDATFATTPFFSTRQPQDLWIYRRIPIPVEIRKNFQIFDIGNPDFLGLVSRLPRPGDEWLARSVLDLAQETAIWLNDPPRDFQHLAEPGTAITLGLTELARGHFADASGLPEGIDSGTSLWHFEFGVRLENDAMLPNFRMGVTPLTAPPTRSANAHNRTYWLDLPPTPEYPATGRKTGLAKAVDLPTLNGPEARYDAALFFDRQDAGLYLFGGNLSLDQPDFAFRDLWYYDVLEARWHPQEPLPAGRHSHVAVFRSLASEIWIFGGQTNDPDYPAGDYWVYSARTGHWEVLEGDPTLAALGNMVASYDEQGDAIYFFGDAHSSNAVWRLTNLDDSPLLEQVVEPGSSGPQASSTAHVAYNHRTRKLVVIDQERGGLSQAWAWLSHTGWRRMCVQGENCSPPSLTFDIGDDPDDPDDPPPNPGCNPGGCQRELMKQAHASNGSLTAESRGDAGFVLILALPLLMACAIVAYRRRRRV